MEEIRSKTSQCLLHVIYRKEDLIAQSQRGMSLSPEPMALQVRAMSGHKGEVFPAHRHLPQERITHGTEESLIIIEGSVEITLYDVDDVPLLLTTLNAGDCVVTFSGGHKHVIIAPTLMYMHKNGPYNGYDKDKSMIEATDV